MIFKLYVSALIILLSYLSGYLYAQKYQKRVNYFREISTDIKLIESEITYAHQSLPLIFHKIGQKKQGLSDQLFECAYEKMREGGGAIFSQIWKEAVEETFHKSWLAPKDKMILIELGSGLGTTDISGQQSATEYAFLNVQKHLKEVEEEKQMKSKLCKTLFTTTGIMIVVLFI